MLLPGALDGLTYANTYALEHVLGWKGILVEASPSSFKLLKDNRPGQVTLHVAVCETPTVVHYADAYDPCCRGIAEFMALGALQSTTGTGCHGALGGGGALFWTLRVFLRLFFGAM